MYYLANICFMCLKDLNKQQTRAEDCTVEQMKYVLPEIPIDPEILLYICFVCHTELDSYYTFKKLCVENYYRWKRFNKLLQDSSCDKDQLCNTIEIENNIIQEKQIDVDLTRQTLQDGTNNFEIEENDVHLKGDQANNIKQRQKETQDDLTSGIPEEENHIYIKEEFDDSEEQNLYRQFLDIKKENEQYFFSKVTKNNEINQDPNNLLKDFESSTDMLNHSVANDCNKKIPENFDCKVNQRLSNVKQNINQIENPNNVISSLKVPRDLHPKIKKESGMKGIECKICKKMLKSKQYLPLHLKTHEGIKDYQCTICDKKFTQSNNLTMHMKVHTGVKDFECSICKKKFVHRGNLGVHMKIHSGIKDFQCSVCDKQFIQRKQLERHMRIHTRSVPNEKFKTISVDTIE